MVYAEECVGSRLIGQLWKRGVDRVNDSLKKKRFECWANKENGA